MTIAIDVEDPGWDAIPGLEELTRKAVAAAGIDEAQFDASIVFTDDTAVAALNAQWRAKDHATNVLSFPANAMPLPDGEARPLGDIVLALGVITREAADQGKTLQQHTAHLIVHGVLHLLGYDHQDGGEASAMERLEADILKGFGISDPYERQ